MYSLDIKTVFVFTVRFSQVVFRIAQESGRGSKILDSRGFDSSGISNLRGRILMPIENLLESLRQRILAGIISVGRLGTRQSARAELARCSEI